MDSSAERKIICRLSPALKESAIQTPDSRPQTFSLGNLWLFSSLSLMFEV
jgi:hypothetical protein